MILKLGLYVMGYVGLFLRFIDQIDAVKNELIGPCR